MDICVGFEATIGDLGSTQCWIVIIITMQHVDEAVQEQCRIALVKASRVALKRAVFLVRWSGRFAHLELVYLVTALVPSLTACLASSPGSRRRTAVWISRLVIVERRL